MCPTSLFMFVGTDERSSLKKRAMAKDHMNMEYRLVTPRTMARPLRLVLEWRGSYHK